MARLRVTNMEFFHGVNGLIFQILKWNHDFSMPQEWSTVAKESTHPTLEKSSAKGNMHTHTRVHSFMHAKSFHLACQTHTYSVDHLFGTPLCYLFSMSRFEQKTLQLFSTTKKL